MVKYSESANAASFLEYKRNYSWIINELYTVLLQ